MKSLCHTMHMIGSGSLPTAAEAPGAELIALNVGAAPPTSKFVGGAARSSLEVALTSASQAQVARGYQGDVLWLPIDAIQRVRFRARISTALTSGSEVAFGLGGAINDDIDTIAQIAGFHVKGTGNVLCESDDGTHDASYDSGIVLGTTFRTFDIAFTDRGGKANVGFYVEDANGQVQRIGQETKFDLSSYTGGFQFFAQADKASGTSVGVLQVDTAEFEWKE